jgi:hypothetical protein
MVKELQELIIRLQQQVTALQNAVPAAQAAPAAAATQVVFAEMPQMLGVKDLADYLTKRAKDIYNLGCKALKHLAIKHLPKGST